VLALSR